MDCPRKSSGKGQIKKYFIDNESETEDYEISLKKQKANQINDKSLLQKKRHNQEKMQKRVTKSLFLVCMAQVAQD